MLQHIKVWIHLFLLGVCLGGSLGGLRGCQFGFCLFFSPGSRPCFFLPGLSGIYGVLPPPSPFMPPKCVYVSALSWMTFSNASTRSDPSSASRIQSPKSESQPPVPESLGGVAGQWELVGGGSLPEAPPESGPKFSVPGGLLPPGWTSPLGSIAFGA